MKISFSGVFNQQDTVKGCGEYCLSIVVHQNLLAQDVVFEGLITHVKRSGIAVILHYSCFKGSLERASF